MRFTILLVCLLGMACGLSDLRAEFQSFVRAQGRAYPRSELKLRYKLFSQTDAFVTLTNSKQLGFELEKNKFSDYTAEEKRRLGGLNHTRFVPQHPAAADIPAKHTNPDSIDWVNEGYLSPVEDQGQCGSCFIFSTLHMLEGRIAQYEAKTSATHPTVRQLSEQHVLDCIYDYSGCGGGFQEDVLLYVKQGNSITSEQALPYTGTSDQSMCKGYSKYQNEVKDIFVTRWNSGHTNRELEDFVAAGPTSVGLAITEELTYYKTGVLDIPGCSSYADHALVNSGYTRFYWLIKNSWGQDWGDKGYLKLSRMRPNMCGVDVWSYQVWIRKRQCTSNQFECTDGKCLPMSQKCDGVKQCSDGSDEPAECTPDKRCGKNFFTCKKDHQCIPFYWQCDGREDCRDVTDEDEHCDATGNCNVFEFECADTQCIPAYEECDGFTQCTDGSDEGAHCGDLRPTKAPTVSPTTPAPVCADKDTTGYCPYWAKSGACESNAGSMQTHCRKSCGFCGGKIPCEDKAKDPICSNYANVCTHDQFIYFLGYNCRKTCDLCI